jgi:hypothetical protein
LPEAELTKALKAAQDRLVTYSDLIILARPYWYKASRERRHKAIHAKAQQVPDVDFGPFPLIYADPP